MNILTSSTPREWRFFRKGNANAIYKYYGENKQFINKVLRVRLRKSQEAYISTIEIVEFMRRFYTHPISEFLLKPEIVKVNSEFLNRLETKGFDLMLLEKNALVLDDVLSEEFEVYNLSKYCKVYTNLKPECNLTNAYSIILELKPKWLYDNKTNYCRNCALKQSKHLERHFCSLDFLHDATIEKGTDDLLSKIPTEVFSQSEYFNYSEVRKSFLQYLRNPENVFILLRDLQGMCCESDQISNIRKREEVSEALLLAMTARDVGIFLKFKKTPSIITSDDTRSTPQMGHFGDDNGQFLIEPIIYDFDVKSRNRFEYWQATERRLQNFYNYYDKTWAFCTVRNSEY